MRLDLRLTLAKVMLFGALACRTESAPGPNAPVEQGRTPASSVPQPSEPPVSSAPPTEPAAPTNEVPTPAPPRFSEGPSVDEKGCVRDVRKHAAEIALRKYEKEVRERLERAPSLADFDDPKCTNTEKMGDLDGDGEDDVDVSTCFTGGNLTWIHFLYLSNRGCPKEVGEIRSGEVSSADSKKNGVKDLEATGSNGCAGNDFVWERYRFDGEAYRVIDKATCYLCDGENPPPGANRHPRCQRERKWRKEDGRDIP